MAEVALEVPQGHQLRQLFLQLTDSSLKFLGLEDGELSVYISDLLVRFVRADNLYQIRNAAGERLTYLVDMLLEAVGSDPWRRRHIRRHIGDYTLFALGVFPESLCRLRRAPERRYYLALGKQSYQAVAEMDGARSSAALYHKLSCRFESCTQALNLERAYLRDPFYRYLDRQRG